MKLINNGDTQISFSICSFSSLIDAMCVYTINLMFLMHKKFEIDTKSNKLAFFNFQIPERKFHTSQFYLYDILYVVKVKRAEENARFLNVKEDVQTEELLRILDISYTE